jgi:hypothetical protein
VVVDDPVNFVEPLKHVAMLLLHLESVFGVEQAVLDHGVCWPAWPGVAGRKEAFDC